MDIFEIRTNEMYQCYARVFLATRYGELAQESPETVDQCVTRVFGGSYNEFANSAEEYCDYALGIEG